MTGNQRLVTVRCLPFKHHETPKNGDLMKESFFFIVGAIVKKKAFTHLS